jgi:hypothetical protein
LDPAGDADPSSDIRDCVRADVVAINDAAAPQKDVVEDLRATGTIWGAEVRQHSGAVKILVLKVSETVV